LEHFTTHLRFNSKETVDLTTTFLGSEDQHGQRRLTRSKVEAKSLTTNPEYVTENLRFNSEEIVEIYKKSNRIATILISKDQHGQRHLTRFKDEAKSLPSHALQGGRGRRGSMGRAISLPPS
jgi:hypothetical protein